MNTQAARYAIEDNEFAWLENIMPIGHGNLRSVGGPVDIGVTLAATCYWMKHANLNNVDYMMCFCTNGSAYQVNLTTFAVTTIGAAGTFSGTSTDFDQWQNSLIVIADATKGIFSWDGTTLVQINGSFAITASTAATVLTVTATAGVLAIGQVITGAGVPANTIIVGFISGTGGTGTYTTNTTSTVGSESMTATSSAPAVGTSVAVYASRVWIANNRTVSFTAPNTYTDFTSTDFGGTFTISDSTLHSNITEMVSANGFLYIMGSDSVNVVSDVRVSTSPAVTVFSNLNLVTTAGTSARASVVPYFRTLWMAAPYGFYGITGASAQKGSDKLDGVFQLLASTSNISGGTVVINKILCLAFMLSYNDPSSGTRPIFAIFFNKKWFVGSQGSTLTFCATASLSGSQTMYATDGTKLFKLFSDLVSNISQVVQTKLWAFGEGNISDVQVLKVGAEIVMPLTPGAVTISADTEFNSVGGNFFGSTSIVVWQNSSLAVTQWKNNSNAIVEWAASGFVWLRGDASNYGKYAGLTLTTSVPGIELNAMQLQYELRARW